MFLCQWSLDIVFGKQKQALDIIKQWGAEKMKLSYFNRSANNRVFVGFIGDSAAHIVDEYVFENLSLRCFLKKLHLLLFPAHKSGIYIK